MNRNRITAIIIAILMLISCSGSAAASGIREMICFIGNGETFGYEITAQAVKLPQFDENRTETLNRLLRPFSFSGRLDARFPWMEKNCSLCLKQKWVEQPPQRLKLTLILL